MSSNLFSKNAMSEGQGPSGDAVVMRESAMSEGQGPSGDAVVMRESAMSEGQGPSGDAVVMRESAMSEGQGPSGDAVVMRESAMSEGQGPSGDAVVMRESVMGDQGQGPSGSGVARLLPCYPCVMTPGGTVSVTSEVATLYRVTDSGRIRSWQPAMTPELVSSDDEDIMPSSLNSRRRLFNNDSGSEVAEDDIDEVPARILTRRLRNNMIGQARETEEESVNMRDVSGQEREDGVDSGRGRGRSVRTALAAPISNIFDWSEDFNTFSGQQEQFMSVPGPTFSSQDPVDIFMKFWDHEFVSMIARETNKYACQVISELSDPDTDTGIPGYLDSWTEVTVEELYKYFAIAIYLSLCQRAQIREYWCTGTLGMTAFRKLMSRNKFLLINKFLHFVDNEDLQERGHSRKIQKVWPVVEHCNRKFAEMYTPSQHLSIDESLLLWKGRLSWKQCIRSKAARFGIKSFELCEASTGYLLQYRLYTGKRDEMHPDAIHGFQDRTAKIVLDLMEGYLDVGHVLVMDNWYNQLPLTRYLKTRRTDVLGTLNRRRSGIPAALKGLNAKRMVRGTSVCRHSGDIALLAWKDVNLVTVMSTYHKNIMVPGTRAGRAMLKPAAVVDYNRYMGGIDLKDQKLSSFLMERKRNRKWYMKVFRRLLSSSLLNSLIIYSKNPMYRVYTHRQFRFGVAEGLTSRYRQPSPSSVPSLEVPRRTSQSLPLRLQPGHHFPIHTEVVSGAPRGKRKQLRCVRCTALKKRVSCTLKCDICKVPLCADKCWKEYHTLQDLRSESI